MILYVFFILCYLKSDEKSEGDYDSDSAWGIWPIRIAASVLAAKLKLMNLQETSFHILLRKTFFKLCNVIQSSWNQLEENYPNLAKFEGAKLVPEWLVTNMFLPFWHNK